MNRTIFGCLLGRSSAHQIEGNKRKLCEYIRKTVDSAKQPKIVRLRARIKLCCRARPDWFKENTEENIDIIMESSAQRDKKQATYSNEKSELNLSLLREARIF